MQFSAEEISAARDLRDAGLSWTPQVGHFVYDESGLIEAPSPFHDRVYFILDLKHFLRRSETIERLAQAMFWLPHYHQCRGLLREMGVADAEVAAGLEQTVIAQGRELLALYAMIRARL